LIGGSPLKEMVNADRPVKEAVLSVDVEMNETG
jgi:hypothetical protein